MTGAELVGPLPTIRFYGGPCPVGGWFVGNKRRNLPAVAYVPPKNTLDPRYRACTDHHVACDCREAEFAEHREEIRYEWQHIREAFGRGLAGHLTWPRTIDGPQCECTGCRIARDLGIWSAGISEEAL